MDTRYSLVVQYRMEGWGSAAELDRRNRLEEILDEALQASGNGECDGGDIGSGSMDLFLEEIVDPDRATATVINTLKNAQELDGAVIALCPYPKDEEDAPEYKVVWPPDFQGEFSVL